MIGPMMSAMENMAVMKAVDAALCSGLMMSATAVSVMPREEMRPLSTSTG